MRYEPRNPHHLRYVRDPAPIEPAKYERLAGDALKLCHALGYDLNTVELAIQDGIPYAIDFLNPAPDADYHSVGPENFTWIVDTMAEFAVKKALSDEQPLHEYHWSSFLDPGGESLSYARSLR